MITPSFSPTATERVLPKLALDFTTASLDPRVTFTRTTGASNPATYVASNGYITLASNNAARFDFDPVTLVCKGLLIEEARTNLVKYSQDFSNASWTLGNATIGSSTTSPDGTANGQSLMETVTSGGHRYYVTSSITATNAATYTYTVFVKANGRNYVRLADTAVSNVTCFFDINAGTVGTVGSAVTASSITNFGNSWYRCSITYVMVGTAATPALNISTDGTTVSYAGDVTKGVYVWGAQLEAGAFPTSYIPTTTTALTRNADIANMTGTNFSDWFNASEGAFQMQLFTAVPTSGSQVPISINDNTTANYLQTYILNSINRLYYKVAVTSTQCEFTAASAVTNNNTFNYCFGYKLNNFQLAVNAVLGAGDTLGTIPTVTQMQIGRHITSSYINGCVAKINYWPQLLTNPEIRAFSK